MGLVKGHGGFVHVQSREGAGSIFSVYIPAKRGGNVGVAAPAQAESPPAQGGLVLLVDDEAAILDVGSMVLADMNYQVVTARDGAEGLRKVSEHRDRLCAVITDQQMPHMDGLAFVRALRATLPRVPVAVGTGRLDDALTAQYRTLDVVFLEKPYCQERLADALRAMLQGRSGQGAC
jgi:CheY-like chemotaxis protein